jgi:hypothetical protein
MMNARAIIYLKRILRACGQALACLLALLILTAMMVIVQAQRDETRPADAAIVLRSDTSAEGRAQLDAALLLHRRSLVRRIVLMRATDGAALGYMSQQGTPADAILVSNQAATLPEQLAQATTTARQSGATSVVLVGDRWGMLRALKITRDRGIEAYGVPARLPGASSLNIAAISAIVRESWSYLSYLLIGR